MSQSPLFEILDTFNNYLFWSSHCERKLSQLDSLCGQVSYLRSKWYVHLKGMNTFEFRWKGSCSVCCYMRILAFDLRRDEQGRKDVDNDILHWHSYFLFDFNFFNCISVGAHHEVVVAVVCNLLKLIESVVFNALHLFLNSVFGIVIINIKWHKS